MRRDGLQLAGNVITGGEHAGQGRACNTVFVVHGFVTFAEDW